MSSCSHATRPPLGRELRDLLWLTLPILGGQLAATLMGFVDTSMAGQASAIDLAAIGIGTSLWMPIYVFVRGILLALTPLVAQQIGAGHFREIGPLVRQGLWVGLFTSFLAIFLLQYAEHPLVWLDVDPGIIPVAKGYLVALCWGIPAICLFQVLSSYCEGLADTKAGMVFGLIGLLVNIPANYVLIYGKFGFPELGAVGCGYATALAYWVMLGLIACYVHRSNRHRQHRILVRAEAPNGAQLGTILRLGLPIGTAIFSECTLFTMIALLIGFMGPEVVAGHQISLNFASIIFMLPLSLSIANTIRVGQALGAGDPVLARFKAYVGVFTAALIALLSASLILLAPHLIAAVYTQDEAVIAIAVQLLFFTAIYQISDAIQLASTGALRGYKDTKWPMVIALSAYWLIALPIGYTLGITALISDPTGPVGLWQGLVLGLTLAAILQSYRLHRVSRRAIG